MGYPLPQPLDLPMDRIVAQFLDWLGRET